MKKINVNYPVTWIIGKRFEHMLGPDRPVAVIPTDRKYPEGIAIQILNPTSPYPWAKVRFIHHDKAPPSMNWDPKRIGLQMMISLDPDGVLKRRFPLWFKNHGHFKGVPASLSGSGYVSLDEMDQFLTACRKAEAFLQFLKEQRGL